MVRTQSSAKRGILFFLFLDRVTQIFRKELNYTNGSWINLRREDKYQLQFKFQLYLWVCSDWNSPHTHLHLTFASPAQEMNIFIDNISTATTQLPVSSSLGQEPSWQALHVYSSDTYSFSLQGVQVQQQLTSPLRITWEKNWHWV